VREYLADTAVYAILNAEVKSDRERRIRGRARVIHRELAAQQKAIRAELRAMQNAKSPFEAQVKAVLELNKAAQYVHAVGPCLRAAARRAGRCLENPLDRAQPVQPACGDEPAAQAGAGDPVRLGGGRTGRGHQTSPPEGPEGPGAHLRVVRVALG
jgi:hypothetical protein